MSKKIKTNVQFVADLMEHSKCGALAQLFVIDAIDKWSKKIANTPLDVLEEQFKEHIINPHSWKAVAEEIQEKLACRFV